MLPPRANPAIMGQDSAVAALREGLQGWRPHHAWLLSGPRGIGKATLAFHAARWLLSGFTADAGNPAHTLFRQVAAGGCPDLRVLERTVDDKRGRLRTEIGIDEVRAATQFLRRTAASDGWRVLIIDGVEFLNRNAANALLKTLEEPPPRAVILLVCQAPQRLLPTIRSRCRTLAVRPLSGPIVGQLVGEAHPELDAQARQAIAELSAGSIGTALAYATEWKNGVIGQIDALIERQDRQAIKSLPDVANRSEGAFEALFAIGERRLTERVRQAVNDRTEGLPHGNRDMTVDAATLTKWIDNLSRLRDIRTQADQHNLDRRQAIASAISLLAAH